MFEKISSLLMVYRINRMEFEKIFDNNRRWVEDKLQTDPDYFNKLSKGQSPEILYIGCSDSRVTAEELMGVKPGEVFIHRNIANLVVSIDNNLNAVVQYAVEFLKVKHIVICGHYECGGVKAALTPSDLGQLNSWLHKLRDVYRLHRSELDAIADEQKRFDRLVEINVREQCINIIKIDHVQRAWAEGGFPKIHGWVFDVRTGRLIDLGLDMEKEFNDVRSIYDLKANKRSGFQ
jgi:carbonic anhydrase